MKVWGVNKTNLLAIAKELGIELYEAEEFYKKNGDFNYTRFMLRPKSDKYRSINVNWGKSRRVHAVCWHGHRDFMIEMFNRFPNAKLVSGIGMVNTNMRTITYNGKEDFNRKYPDTDYTNVPLTMMGNYYKTCTCVTEIHGKRKNRVITDNRFWDCECERDFVHPKTIKICNKCGSKQEDCPDSRVNEVKYLYNPIGE